ncbi:MAG: SagB/ThcOx family dehydrogenase [Moorea sp. SIO2B7]|nr:SagB/ThcOx family dehydrogenase [Moorena sp. SIO2B7]
MFNLILRPEITITPQEDNLIVASPGRKLTFHEPKSGLKTALNYLKQGDKTFSQLQDFVTETDGEEKGELFAAYLERLTELGWIKHSVLPLATTIPMTGNYNFYYPEIDNWPEICFTLSRFAYLHQVNGEMLLESPLSHSKIILSDWRGSALIAKLSQPQTVTSLISGIPDITVEIGQNFLCLLLATEMLTYEISSTSSLVEEKEEEEEEAWEVLEEEKPPLVYWEFHDLLFHSRSRNGRHDHPLGGTFRFKGKTDPLPVVKPLMNDKVIKLPQPNLEDLIANDKPLTEVLESRQSIRKYDEKPISKQDLGKFLYRCLRVKKIFDTEMGELSRRPYPGGGAIYELEIYPVVNQCEGLEKGIYQYHPLDHVFCPLSQWSEEAEALITDAWLANGQQVKPQVLLVITARFGRMFWKYQSMAYAAILKHVGVLYQTFYLVATSMNLAPCAIGAGNADLFAIATDINYYEESSVGEFMLGSVEKK